MNRDQVLRWGGVAAGGVLTAFGIAVIVLSLVGRGTLDDELSQQKITGTPDMTPSAIKVEVEKAGLKNVDIPSCDVAGKPIDSGPRARCFSQYMFIHALEATGGFVYAEMGQYEAKPGTPKEQLAPGGGTNNTDFAAINPATTLPAQNGTRQVWVTETALSTGLNVSFISSLLVLFTVVVGVALVLAGVGFILLAIAAFPGRGSTAPPTEEAPPPAT